MPKVYNKHHGDAPATAVFVGRPSEWGNPFIVGPGQTREQAIGMYKVFMSNNPMRRKLAKKHLKGRDLVCFCAPHPCHADVLMAIANEEDNVN